MFCPNCGASLTESHYCEYCGTDFNVGKRIGDKLFILNLENEKISCYIREIRFTDMTIPYSSRTVDGRIIKPIVTRKRTITLQEY